MKAPIPVTTSQGIQALIENRVNALSDKLTDLVMEYALEPEYAKTPLQVFYTEAGEQWGQVILAPALPGKEYKEGPVIQASRTREDTGNEIRNAISELPILPGRFYEGDDQLNFGAIIEMEFLNEIDAFPTNRILPVWSVASWQAREDVISVTNGIFSDRERSSISKEIYQRNGRDLDAIVAAYQSSTPAPQISADEVYQDLSM
jgi:hypothetical protein